MAGAFVFAREPRRALEHFATARRWIQAAAELDPGNADYAGRAGYAMRYQAKAYGALGDYAQAATLAQEALTAAESEYRRHPESMSRFQHGGIVWLELAEYHTELEDLDTVRQNSAAALTIFDKLCDDEPANVFHRRNAWEAHSRVADALIRFASDESRPVQEQVDLWTAARDHLHRSLAHHATADEQTQKTRELLGLIDSARQRLATCESAIERLHKRVPGDAGDSPRRPQPAETTPSD